jgi:broad specificity phosphatase PhoE
MRACFLCHGPPSAATKAQLADGRLDSRKLLDVRCKGYKLASGQGALPRCIYTSPARRAKDTATVLASVLRLQFGSQTEIRTDDYLCSFPWPTQKPKLFSGSQVRKNLDEFLTRILKAGDKVVWCVTHESLIREIYKLRNKEPPQINFLQHVALEVGQEGTFRILSPQEAVKKNFVQTGEFSGNSGSSTEKSLQVEHPAPDMPKPSAPKPPMPKFINIRDAIEAKKLADHKTKKPEKKPLASKRPLNKSSSVEKHPSVDKRHFIQHKTVPKPVPKRRTHQVKKSHHHVHKRPSELGTHREPHMYTVNDSFPPFSPRHFEPGFQGAPVPNFPAGSNGYHHANMPRANGPTENHGRSTYPSPVYPAPQQVGPTGW